MANFIKNWTIFLKGEDKSPLLYEALYGEGWDLSRFQVPFYKVWFYVETDNKLNP